MKLIDFSKYEEPINGFLSTHHKVHFSLAYRSNFRLRGQRFPLYIDTCEDEEINPIDFECKDCGSRKRVSTREVDLKIREKGFYLLKHTCLGVTWFVVIGGTCEAIEYGFSKASFFFSNGETYLAPFDP